MTEMFILLMYFIIFMFILIFSIYHETCIKNETFQNVFKLVELFLNQLRKAKLFQLPNAN